MGTLVPVGTGVFEICYDDKIKPEDSEENKRKK